MIPARAAVLHLVGLGHQVACLEQRDRLALDVGEKDPLTHLQATEEEARAQDHLGRVRIAGRVVQITIGPDRPTDEESGEGLARSHFNLRVRATRACNQAT